RFHPPNRSLSPSPPLSPSLLAPQSRSPIMFVRANHRPQGDRTSMATAGISSISRARRQTRQVKVGDVALGGDARVVLQSMTSTYTYDIDATVAQINRLAGAGCDIVRVAVPDKRDTEALPEIIRQTNIPIVADVHFHYQRALEAVKAGVHKIRLNPGNIKDRKQVNEVIRACKDA